MKMNQRAARWFARASLAGVLACGGGSLPTPPFVGQPQSALAPVRYPPPPARVELVPPRPSGDTVWLDGEWSWRGRRWAWLPGRWLVPPKGARFSPWTMVRGGDGTPYFASGAWRDAKGRDVAEPAALAVAKPTPGAVVNPEGEREITGSTVRRRPVAAPPAGSATEPSPATPDAGSVPERELEAEAPEGRDGGFDGA